MDAGSELDPDRTLALSYVPPARRKAVEALWRLDAAMGALVAQGREPRISLIKLAWWRETLERLDGAPAPAEPVLQALAAHLLPLGVSGMELSRIEEGWAILPGAGALQTDELGAYARGRGGNLFALTARLLGGEPGEERSRAGEGWALADLARRSLEPVRAAALRQAKARISDISWPAPLRPLGMLAVLAARDVARGASEAQGSPGRMLRMFRHRLTGR